MAVARNGAGHSTAAELLAHHGQLHEAEAEPTVLLGHRQRRPVELDHPAPQLLGAHVLLDDAADERDRALALEDGAHRLLERALIVGELEFHAAQPRRDHEGVDRHRTVLRTTTGLRSSSTSRSPHADARRATARTTSTSALTSASALPRAPVSSG